MDSLQTLLSFILHVDVYLNALVTTYGAAVYVLLFIIIFSETGLVILPFLPGDSLLFTAGALAASQNNTLEIQLLFVVLLVAAILGNKTNYWIGRFVGPKIYDKPQSWLFRKKHLEQAHAFYMQHGGKTIIFARFIPIIRTFVPFIAGVAAMPARLFAFYNLISGFLWVGLLLGAGYYFGTLPWVSERFNLIIYSIIVLSLLPPIMTYLYHKTKAIFGKHASNTQ